MTNAFTVLTATESLLGYHVYTGTLQELVHEVKARVRAPIMPSCWLACLNPHSYAIACDTPNFAGALRAATWLLPDGAGIVLASRWLGGRIRSRLCGPDAFFAISKAMNDSGPFSAMFLGSTEVTLSAIVRRYRADFPNVSAVTTFSPPFLPVFSDSDADEMRAAIRDAKPDLLWVGLTAPKQELLLDRLGPDAGYRFAGAIGAAFDFYGGNVTRSAPVFRRLGVEWLPRLLREPRRLWRRMFISAPLFLSHVAKQFLAARVLRRR